MSEFDGQSKPVECYEFYIQGDGTYLYTSGMLPVVAQGRTYNALPGLSRESIGIAMHSESKEFSVKLPATHILSRKFAMFETPAKTKLVFKRFQRDDMNNPTFISNHILFGASITDEVCTLKFPDSIESALGGKVPKLIVAKSCNWNLGDPNCKINLDSRKVSFPSSSVRYDGRPSSSYYQYVVSNGQGVPFLTPLSHWNRGILTQFIGSQASHRTIVGVTGFNQAQFGYSGLVRVQEPFDTHPANASYMIVPGCSKLWFVEDAGVTPSCSTYSNQANFGGFPYMPTENYNPFRVNLSKSQK